MKWGFEVLPESQNAWSQKMSLTHQYGIVEINYRLAYLLSFHCLWKMLSEDPLSQVSGSGEFHASNSL